ncbi:FAD-binding oxidoreductase [Streptomyces sp. NPDC046805]|uniref:FAD-binding oxidoreductase n=1 Tax=Streptomyces sp. NPDC046805 TaxID=3155134 RepID=UPI0033DE183B
MWREWEVAKKIRETDDVVTFVVKRIDDRLVKSSLPGQYVTVRMMMPDGVPQPRQYSLTRADDGESRQFSVKRVRGFGIEPAGEMSTLLHESVDVGDIVTTSLPYGDVVLDDAGRPVVFATAGIGIAPAAGMLSHLVKAGSGLHITLLHGDLDEASFPLRRQVVTDVLESRHAEVYAWYEKGAETMEPLNGVFQGRMDLEDVDLPDDALYYMCGPLPFMQGVRTKLLERGVAPEDIQYEVFGPDLWQADLD